MSVQVQAWPSSERTSCASNSLTMSTRTCRWVSPSRGAISMVGPG